MFPFASFVASPITVFPSLTSNLNSPSLSVLPFKVFVPLNVMLSEASYIFLKSNFIASLLYSIFNVPSLLSVTFTVTVYSFESTVIPLPLVEVSLITYVCNPSSA